ncbi:39S ribosomal protein L39, mitochondrial isoform X2 [Macaca thibetana thibetana]|uniref:39S ribosomal protein L39, mitochondrial isoform X2 n=1 Tax=Macaca thibetana thibetana TaxID=257877 RepID=UPI0021BCF042|nr:39S ribosomal protein L39, mitochondrial isoform X2 [Macaca thibetana thibetana]
MEALTMGVRALRLWRVASGLGISWRFIATSPASQLSPTELTEMRNDLFNKEKARQLSLTPRTEKIEVKHVGKTDPGTVFVMNKNISTPYSCAMHLSEWYCRKSILALVDGQPWDMYKPLTKSCEIKFLTFKDRDPGEVNKAYWRSCAMMMGCVIERAFKDEYMVNLVRAPEVPVISGAFCYDVVLDSKLDEWMPTKENLRSFTKDGHALIYKDLPFETLEVEAKVALEIFQHNKYKIDFIEEKASQNPERIVKLHRIGDFIDVSEGPLIPRTSICFQYEVSAVHNLQPTQPSLIRRFQGVSLPIHLRAHFTIWDKLLERSRKMLPEASPEAHAGAVLSVQPAEPRQKHMTLNGVKEADEGCQRWSLAVLLKLGLKLLSSSIPPRLILQSTGIAGVSHPAWQYVFFK